MTEVTAEHAYLALITPPGNPDDHSEGTAFVVANRFGRAPPLDVCVHLAVPVVEHPSIPFTARCGHLLPMAVTSG
jgi:hypothetical protein